MTSAPVRCPHCAADVSAWWLAEHAGVCPCCGYRPLDASPTPDPTPEPAEPEPTR